MFAAGVVSALSGLSSAWASAPPSPKAGDVWSWGENFYGSVGDGTQYDTYPPHKAKHTLGTSGQGHLNKVIQVAAGGFQSMALKSDGTVWAWGRNDLGPLGVRGTTDSWTPKQVIGPKSKGYLTGVAFVGFVDYLHLAAVKRDGSVWTWGRIEIIDDGKGNRVTHALDSPALVPDLTRVAQISGHLALKKDGTVWMWNDNGGKVPGFKKPRVHTPPRPVKGPGGVGLLAHVVSIYNATAQESDISSDNPHPRVDNREIPYAGSLYYAVTSDGKLYRWGSLTHTDASTGRTTTQTWANPVRVATIENVAKVKGGMALKKDGTVVYLIDGVAVPSLTHVVDVDRDVAVKADGAVWTWTTQFTPATGSHQAVSKDTLVRVPGLPVAFAVSATTEFLIIAKPVGK